MKISVLYNPTQVDEATAASIVKQVESRGHGVEVLTSAECVSGERLLVLGGDGTVLRAVRKAAERDIPIVAVNYGTLGFLTEFDRGETEQAVDFILSGQHSVLKRSMIEVELNGRTMHCLNEVVLSRGGTTENASKVVKFSVSINGNQAGRYLADGMVLATPTGSIAYSLSAGGSILTPDCENFILTPICAFSLKSRPIVCSDKSEIEFSFPEAGVTLMLHGDGDFLGIATHGDTVRVRKSSRSATFLLRKQGEFFRRLTDKING